MKNFPYVVSADIYLLLEKWTKQKNFVLPEKEFFKKLRKEFSNKMFKIFPSFELISDEEISKHIKEITFNSNIYSVSIDPIYSSYCNFYIGLTRKVDLKGEYRGLQHRFSNNSLQKQLNQLKTYNIKEICLVDDVIFSGVLMEKVIKLFSHIGINVPIVCAGIGTQKGISRILDNKRIVTCRKIYNEIIDEVCERDFYLGIPYSGRSLIGTENIGLPYVIPFGKPMEWASIPSEVQKDFSKFCINQTIILFEEIQKKSKRKISCADIERKVPGQPETGDYLEFLKSITLKENVYV